MLNVKKTRTILAYLLLKQKGSLISDSKRKADNLVDQFQTVFAKVKNSILPDLSKKHIPSARNITMDSKGVEKLLFT